MVKRGSNEQAVAFERISILFDPMERPVITAKTIKNQEIRAWLEYRSAPIRARVREMGGYVLGMSSDFRLNLKVCIPAEIAEQAIAEFERDSIVRSATKISLEQTTEALGIAY